MPLTRKLSFVGATLLAFTLIAPTLAPPVVAAVATPTVPVSLDPTLKIHPFLQYGLQADPTRPVRVIVQKTSDSASAYAITRSVPGVHVVEEFTVVPAFVASLPVSALTQLAHNRNVRYLSPDGGVQVISGQNQHSDDNQATTEARAPKPRTHPSFNPGHLLTTYPIDTGATTAWSGSDGHVETGSKVTLAVIDSGIDAQHADLSGQVAAVNVNASALSTGDSYGHGTHVAGIIIGHGSSGEYLGVAPNASVISIKIADDTGLANESDLLRGLDWVYLNREESRIRALNLSVSTSVPQSYSTSAVDAAVENLWHLGVTVVTSAGNLGTSQDAVWYAPGNDPYVISVGCLDENATVSTADDSLCPISSRGVTEDGFARPDLVAPGRKIVSALATSPAGTAAILAGKFPDRVTSDGQHIRLSGTSMAAPMVTGAVALLLERHSKLTPSQLKQLLVNSAHSYPGQPDVAGMLNISDALTASDHPPVATQAPILPASGVSSPAGATTLLWDGARWGSTYWDGARWGSTYWDGARWGSAEFDGARWGSAYWDGARWGSTYWDGARWGNAAWVSAGSFD